MEDIGRGSGGSSDTKHLPPQLSVPIQAEETTRWWQTQNRQRHGTAGCTIVLNGQIFFTLPSPDQHNI